MTGSKNDKETVVIIPSSNEDYGNGIINFETCTQRNREKIRKAGCCSSGAVEGYYCKAINKFPVSFSKDCKDCKFYTDQP